MVQHAEPTVSSKVFVLSENLLGDTVPAISCQLHGRFQGTKVASCCEQPGFHSLRETIISTSSLKTGR